MTISRKDIENIINDINSQKSLKTQLDKELYIMEKYVELYNEYPFLLKKLTKVLHDKDTENLNMLFLLIDKMESINSGKENKTVVETELGQQLADKYLHKNKQD